jgi:hypothetical protein
MDYTWTAMDSTWTLHGLYMDSMWILQTIPRLYKGYHDQSYSPYNLFIYFTFNIFIILMYSTYMWEQSRTIGEPVPPVFCPCGEQEEGGGDPHTQWVPVLGVLSCIAMAILAAFGCLACLWYAVMWPSERVGVASLDRMREERVVSPEFAPGASLLRWPALSFTISGLNGEREGGRHGRSGAVCGHCARLGGTQPAALRRVF